MLSKDSPARRSSQDKDIGEIDLIHFINSSDTPNFKTIKDLTEPFYSMGNAYFKRN